MSKKKYFYRLTALLLMLSFLLSCTAFAAATDEAETQTATHITNVALGKAATASSYESDSRSPSKANDGSASTLWVASNGNAGNWWMVDLGGSYNLLGSEIVFEHAGDVWQYMIEASTDGNEWTTVADRTANTSGNKTQTDAFEAAARYIKVTVTGVPSSRWTAIAEVCLWGEETFTITGSNVANLKSTSASSEENASRASSNIVDGDLNSLWIANSGAAGNWVKVDLGGRYSLNAVRLTFENASRVWNYKIQTSLNDVDWITVVDKSSSNFAMQTQAFPISTINARYIRVLFEAAPGSAWTALAELEVFGTAAGPAGTPKKILVIVPHEDDEALIAAGVIHNAILEGDEVKVAIVTNGDCNGWNYDLGVNRLNESIAAMGVLGLSVSNMTAFGYSDTGGFEPWTRYTDSFLYKIYHAASDTQVISSNYGNTTTYGVSGVLDDYHYQETGEHASYTRQNFVGDITSYIEDFMPDEIYTTSAYDLHGDHAYLNIFVTDIVRKIVEENPAYTPVIHENIIHSTEGDVLWPIIDTDPTPLQNFTAPQNLAGTPLVWEDRISVPMPNDMLTLPRSTNMKNVCLATYTSQYSSYIGSFTKADEIFWVKDFANLAYRASIAASSAQADAPASYVADGVIGSYLQLPDRNWIAANETTGAWIQMTWDEGQNISQIVLHGCPDGDNTVTQGTLSFSDGTSIAVGQLPADGKPLSVDVECTGVTWVRFTISGVSGTSAGLSEMEVF